MRVFSVFAPAAVALLFSGCQAEGCPVIYEARYVGPDTFTVKYKGQMDSDSLFIADGRDLRYDVISQISILTDFREERYEATCKVNPDFRPGDHITVSASGPAEGSAYFDVPD